jgi:hypothetical protein
MISPTQRPPPDNTQPSQEADIHAPAGFEPAIPASERPQILALSFLSRTIRRYLNVDLHRVVYYAYCSDFCHADSDHPILCVATYSSQRALSDG